MLPLLQPLGDTVIVALNSTCTTKKKKCADNRGTSLPICVVTVQAHTKTGALQVIADTYTVYDCGNLMEMWNSF